MFELSDETIKHIFGIAGTVIATYFYIAPAVPFYKVIKGKVSYKDSPGILLICSFMNCILWADYGLIKNAFEQYFANILGGAITLIWITIFLIFLGQKNICLGLTLNFLLIAVIGALAYVFYYVIDVEITGKVAMIFNVLMYAAPLEKIYRVCKTGKYELIPIFSSGGGTLCSLCWLMYGVYLNDPNVIIPNALGLFFGILQCILFVIFYCKAKKSAEEFAKDDDDVI